MSKVSVFDTETVLPDSQLSARENGLLGFSKRYDRVYNQLRLLLDLGQLGAWSKDYHQGVLPICSLVADQYPLVIFHGDVGTGKTAMAECIANRIVRGAGRGDSVLRKRGKRGRGRGSEGAMGALLRQDGVGV